MTRWGGSVDYNYHASNARWVPWPNYSEFLDYLESNNYPRVMGQEPVVPRPVVWALDAAVSRIAERCGFEVRRSLPEVRWRVRTFEGLATVLGPCPGGEFDPCRVGASVCGPGVPAGAVLEAVAGPHSALLSAPVSLSSHESGVVLTVGVSPACPDEPGLVPPEVFNATLLYGSRLFKRRQAVEGIAGASELGGLIRYSALDPDVEAAIANWVVWGLA